MTCFRKLLTFLIGSIVVAAPACAADRVSDPDRREKVITINDTPQMIVDGARKRLATISRIEQVTLRSGNMQYEVKGRNGDGKTVVLKLDPEGGILGVEN